VLASEESAHYYMNFPYDLNDLSKGFASTENTLFFALLTARMYSHYPEKYERAMELQDSIYRRREWPCHFFDDKHIEPVVSEVEGIFANRGLTVFKEMEDGSSLDATLMRKGLPLKIDETSDLEGSWLQVAQRISRSEEGIARWEVASSTKEGLDEAVGLILAVTDRYVERGEAEYV
jgi:phosphomannomutase